MDEAQFQQRLTPKKWSLRIGGLTLFGGGGCLMWTIVLIPIAFPVAIIGLLMFIASFFVKTQPITCPACHAISAIEKNVAVVVCPHCNTAIKHDADAWVRV